MNWVHKGSEIGHAAVSSDTFKRRKMREMFAALRNSGGPRTNSLLALSSGARRSCLCELVSFLNESDRLTNDKLGIASVDPILWATVRQVSLRDRNEKGATGRARTV